jgi:hypothetical protein
MPRLSKKQTGKSKNTHLLELILAAAKPHYLLARPDLVIHTKLGPVRQWYKLVHFSSCTTIVEQNE